jgi:hypothetical protein
VSDFRVGVEVNKSMRPVTVMRGLLEVPRAPGLNPRVTGLSCDEAQRDAPRHLIRDRGGIYVSCDVKSTRPDPTTIRSAF